jgi:MFS family permease
MPLELAALLFVGYGSITFNSMAKTVLQLTAVPEMRGRVMALWGLAWLGSTPIGGPIVGWVGQEAGARWSLVVGGVPTLLCGLLALPLLVKIDRRRDDPSRPPAGTPRLPSSFLPNGRGASPPHPMTVRSDETSDANTTTELR